MRISDWSSDVCSSDLHRHEQLAAGNQLARCLEDLLVDGIFKPDDVGTQHPAAARTCTRGERAARKIFARAMRRAAQSPQRTVQLGGHRNAGPLQNEIGRASWRERVGQYV